jgi:hypothetical protein
MDEHRRENLIPVQRIMKKFDFRGYKFNVSAGIKLASQMVLYKLYFTWSVGFTRHSS